MNWTDAISDLLNEIPQSELKKGKRIKKNWALEATPDGLNKYVIAVPSESSTQVYKIQATLSTKGLKMKCNCLAYDSYYSPCKHCVAAALFIQDSLMAEVEDSNDFAEHIITFKATYPLNLTELYRLAGNPNESEIIKLTRKITLVDEETNAVFLYVHPKANLDYGVSIQFDGKDNYEAGCDCGENATRLCIHSLACFHYIIQRWGARYFKKEKDYTEEKNQLLKPYGLTENDPEAALFTWNVNYYGQLSLANKPNFIIPAGKNDFLLELKNSITGKTAVSHNLIRPTLQKTTLIDYEIGILFNFSVHKHVGLELNALYIEEKKGVQKIKKININTPSNYTLLQPLADELFYPLVELSEQRLLHWLASQADGGAYVNPYSLQWQNLSIQRVDKIQKHFSVLLRKAWPYLCDHPLTYIHTEGKFSQPNAKPVKLSKEPLTISFEVLQSEKLITIQIAPSINGERYRGPVNFLSQLLFLAEDTLYLPANEELITLLEKFKQGKLQFPISEKQNVLLHLILPLKEKYEVEMNTEDFSYEMTDATPLPRVLLSELNEQSLLVRPQFSYHENILDYSTETELITETDGRLFIIKRNKAEEKKLYDFLRTLHPRFAAQNNNQHYYLPFAEVMKNNWFFTAIKQVEAAGYSVYGVQELKKFRYNANTPILTMEGGSGTDWFDLKISAQWGDQHVYLKELRQAIINRQESVLLDDGTLGLIPQKWISQYRTLMKIGNEQNGSLNVSKLHFGLLDQLDMTVNSEEMQKEIAAKKKKIQGFNGLQTGKLPKAIKATLRPYQQSGFHWMKTLDDLGWGGCLADDMGLGKTLQAITFLQYIKETHKGSTSLVICPTSLLFNWENELQKFCPTLKFHVYYGLQRTFSDEHFEQYDLIITSYGIARNDLEALIKFQWHYVILDESQAIKNPEAQVTRAVSHLKAKNKLILTGTPVQNNTYDLYAQFNFLNPGLLGNRDFFREEFANAIDKNGDKTKAEELRRLVYPFMLRRTKEQVATDLPDKTETILWCTMGTAQRKVYDEYKNHYRHLLLQKIDEDGMGKSGIYVLEGLLRLRQICDHPVLLKDAANVNDSVKTEELIREIQENTGEHKLLVFSQFTEMLSLIRNELQHHKISFCYLDGSTPAMKRKEQVQKFQADETIKVFLISLKAGGVGLNLTAADYVYLVDPWWNPAAEQQAIDRTHRIGQTRKIFAYKMICKDTVEEKILQLQQKKKALANKLVSEETGFVKKLTRDDVAFLFS